MMSQLLNSHAKNRAVLARHVFFFLNTGSNLEFRDSMEKAVKIGKLWHKSKTVLPTHPRAFISYSWDDRPHKEWVINLATQLRQDGVEARLDYWHTVPGDQLPEFMEREIREADYVVIVCTPSYKIKSEGRTGGVGYEGGIITAEVFARQNHRKFIPVLARGSWTESAASWLLGKRYSDLSDATRYIEGYRDLLSTILGTRPKPPPLGPLPSAVEAISAPNPPRVNLQLYEKRFPIYEAAMQLIGYVIQRGTCTFEQHQQFSTDVRQARFLFNEDIETYLQKLRNEGLALYAGEKKREGLNPSSEEYEKSVAAWHDRLIWFTEQFSEVKKRFDPFLQIQE